LSGGDSIATGWVSRGRRRVGIELILFLAFFDGERLRAFFDRLTSLTLPIAPDLSNLAGADGETTQLALFGDLHSHVRFQWWSDYPPAWEPLVTIAKEMLSAFGAR